jgi:methionyl-tRNA synthetase
MSENILVAVAWPYANGPRHVGHVAGFGVPSDIFARYHRLKGNRVLMISGTDEHGTPITVAAEQEGVTPRELADRYNRVIGEDLRELGLSYDLFTRTTTQNHYRIVQEIFTTLLGKGYIIKQKALGTFSSVTGRTLPDRYVEGTCPICSYGAARGDQCDHCGHQLDPTDLIQPRSRIDGRPPVFRETEHFYLDLPAFTGQLRAWLEPQDHWRPNVRTFSLGLLPNLKPRAITRDLEWGVPIPLAGYDDKRIYVWFDAVIGYLSASIEWAQWVGRPDAWKEWWLNPASHHYYFMGKDNIVFHSIIWPSMLLGCGADIGGGAQDSGDSPLQLPYEVASSEYLTMEGKKFSSSRGVTIYVRDVLSRYAADALRFYLAIAGPETQDTDFTWAEFVRRNNDELVANWGNLVHRVLTMAYRFFGQVPEPGTLEEADRSLLTAVEGGYTSVGGLIEGARFKAALGEVLRLADLANKYVSDQEPWKLIGNDRQRAATVVYTVLQVVDDLKVLCTPFLPFSSQKLHALLGYQGFLAGPLVFHEVAEAPGVAHRILTGDYHSWVGRWEPTRLPVGQRLQQPVPLFNKLDESVIEEELTRLRNERTRLGS